MDIEVIKACTHLSDEEKMSFPEVVQRLAKAEIDLYYADLIRATKTFYKGDRAHVENCLKVTHNIENSSFCAEGIIDTIRKIQLGEIKYREFIKRIVAFGVINYLVFIKGKKAIYFGRNGEQHVEEFSK